MTFSFLINSEHSKNNFQLIVEKLKINANAHFKYKFILSDKFDLVRYNTKTNKNELIIITSVDEHSNNLIRELIKNHIPVVCNQNNSNSVLVEDWKTGFVYRNDCELFVRLEHFIRQSNLFQTLIFNHDSSMLDKRIMAFNESLSFFEIKNLIKLMGFYNVKKLKYKAKLNSSSIIVTFECGSTEYIAKIFQTRINNYCYWLENVSQLLIDKRSRFNSELYFSDFFQLPKIIGYSEDSCIIIRKYIDTTDVAFEKYLINVILSIHNIYLSNEIKDQDVLSKFNNLNRMISLNLSIHEIDEYYKQISDKHQNHFYDYSLRVEFRRWKNSLQHIEMLLSIDIPKDIIFLENIIEKALSIEHSSRIVYLHGGIVQKNIVYNNMSFFFDVEKAHVGWEGYDVASFIFSIQESILNQNFDTNPFEVINDCFNIDLIIAWLAMIFYMDIVKKTYTNCNYDHFSYSLYRFKKIVKKIRGEFL